MASFTTQSRNLIKIIQRLDSLCIDATLPSLPKFVVVGDQSHGKSSIIEAICDIKLPRGQGTVTRCPFQITTSAAKTEVAWKCTITLQRKHAYNPHFKSYSPTQYDRWPEDECTPPFEFATIYDKSQLEDALVRAQLAILNPSYDCASFQKGCKLPIGTQTPQVGFSPNSIHLEIEGPDLPELSFIDLPGAINVHRNPNEQYLVPFIEQLVKCYLRDEQALVLLTISADQDVENSTSFRFVQQCGAVDRCMGVLTKPDLVTSNRVGLVRSVISREEFQLGNAWYVTKQLSPEELEFEADLAHATARQREEAFFSQRPWSTHFVGLEQRFGIVNLQGAISHKLTDHILAALPAITERVQERLRAVTRQLREFPERPHSASHAVMDEAQSVYSTIAAHLRGDDSSTDHFRSDYKSLLRELRAQLRAERPRISFSTPGYVKKSISIDIDDGDEDGRSATPIPRSLFETPSKKRKVDKSDFPTPLQAGRSASKTPRKSSYMKAEGVVDSTSNTIPLKLDRIKEMFDRRSTSGLPDQVDPKATEQLIKDSLVGWQGLVENLLSRVFDLIKHRIGTSIVDTLFARRGTRLFTDTNNIVVTLVKSLLREEEKRILYLVSCEMHKPITYNFQHLRQQTETEKTQLLKLRYIERVNEHYDTLESKGMKVPTGEDRRKKCNSDDNLRAQLGPDRYSREVEALATPLVYYDLASARMLDTIANHLEFGLLYGLETNLRSALREGLKVTDEEYCQALLAEDPQREELRRRLTIEKGKLEEAVASLQGLGAEED